ncbi:MAG TPA: hypothetical protein VGJ04_03280 [Pirellulales bacterium]
MYHFLHRHRYWFLAMVIIAVVAIFYFQMRGDPGGPGRPVNPPAAQNP